MHACAGVCVCMHACVSVGVCILFVLLDVNLDGNVDLGSFIGALELNP